MQRARVCPRDGIAATASAQLRIRFVPTHAQTTTVAAQPCSPAPTLLVVPNLSQGLDLQAIAPPTDQFALGFQAISTSLTLTASPLKTTTLQ